MDWTPIITRNRAALATIVAALIAMAGWAAMPAPGTARLPRALRLSILRLLLPAESAVRRLIVVAATGLAVVVPPLRRRPPAGPAPIRVLWRGRMTTPAQIAARLAADPAPARRMAFRLADAPKRLARRRWLAAGRARPRVLSFTGAPPAFPPAPSDDGVDANRLALRLAAISAALNDLPAEARRLAVARARATMARDPSAPVTRRPPLRPGRPPGHRRRRTHAVDVILADCDAFAREAERDTS